MGFITFIQLVVDTWNSFMNSVIHGSHDQFLFFFIMSKFSQVHFQCYSEQKEISGEIRRSFTDVSDVINGLEEQHETDG